MPGWLLGAIFLAKGVVLVGVGVYGLAWLRMMATRRSLPLVSAKVESASLTPRKDSPGFEFTVSCKAGTDAIDLWFGLAHVSEEAVRADTRYQRLERAFPPGRHVQLHHAKWFGHFSGESLYAIDDPENQQASRKDKWMLVSLGVACLAFGIFMIWKF